MVKVEVASGVWRDAEKLTGRRAERAREIAVEKGQLVHDTSRLLDRLAREYPEACSRLPARLRRLADAGEGWTSAPVALAVLRDEKRQVRALVNELEGSNRKKGVPSGGAG